MIPLQTGDVVMVCASDKARVPPELVTVKFMLAEQHCNPEPPFDSFWSVSPLQDPSARLERNGREVWLHDDCLMLVWASPRE